MTDTNDVAPSERRNHERHRVCLAGRIFIPGAGAVFDCTVTNLSVGGAGF